MTESEAQHKVEAPAQGTAEKVAEGPDIYRVRIPYDNPPGSSTNCYVVVCAGEALVVDVGYDTPEAPAIWAAAFKQIGIDPSSVSVFLTHLHLDHAGALDAVAGPRTPVYVSNRAFEEAQRTNAEGYSRYYFDQRRLEGFGGTVLERTRAYGTVWLALPRAPHAFRFVEPGSLITVGDTAFTCIDEDGHSLGQLGLFEPRSRTLFCGDQVLFDVSPVLDQQVPYRGAVRHYLDAQQRIRELGVQRLFQGHGELFGAQDTARRIDWLIDHKHKRIADMLRAVEAHPNATGAELVAADNRATGWMELEDMGDFILASVIESAMTTLHHLVETGAVERTFNGELFRYRAAR